MRLFRQIANTRRFVQFSLLAVSAVAAEELNGQGFLIDTVRTGMVFDHAGQNLYVSDGDGLLKTFNLSTRTFGRTYHLGGWVWGIDIDPDDSFILAAQDTVSALRGRFQRVDLATGTVTNIHYTRAFGEIGGWDVAVGSNNLAMVTTQFAGSGWTPLRQIDLSTNAISIRADAPGSGALGQVRKNTQVRRNANGTRFVFMETDSSAGPVFTYSAVTNTFGPRFDTNTLLDNSFGAVDPSGNRIVLSTYNAFGWPAFLNTAPDFASVHTFNQVQSGVAFDAVRNIFYGVNRTTNQIIAYSTSNFTELYRLSIGEELGTPVPFTPFNTGTLVASPDGRWLALETNSGIRLFQLPAPVLATNPATNVASFFSVLNGSLNPQGLATDGYFQYGPTTSYGFTTPLQSQTGDSLRNISVSIGGLTASTTYHFRIVASNTEGTRYGGDKTFTTLTPTGPPGVTGRPALNVTSSSALITGAVNPHGLPTTLHFQYGPTASYGFSTSTHMLTGNTFENTTANITGLLNDETYHFRIVATNSAGTLYGRESTFVTRINDGGPPIITTKRATFIASRSATLNGSLNPAITNTRAYFEYGPSTSYGFTAPVPTQAGTTFRNISANVSGLMASTTYHFRIVATNLSGDTHTSDATFTTLSPTGLPLVTTSPPSGITSSAAMLRGSVNPHGLTTSVYFEYGRTASYGSITASQNETGSTYQGVGVNVSGLSASTTYHFRIVATNSAGTRYGGDRQFRTP